MFLLMQVAGELKMIAKDFNIAVLVCIFLFPVRENLEILQNFKMVVPDLEELENIYIFFLKIFNHFEVAYCE